MAAGDWGGACNGNGDGNGGCNGNGNGNGAGLPGVQLVEPFAI
jgi:hypothetical protein